MSCFNCWSPGRRSPSSPDGNNGAGAGPSQPAAPADSGEGTLAAPWEPGAPSAVQTFQLGELVAATNHFNEANNLGDGALGRVFRGNLQSGDLVAIKQFSVEGLNRMEFIVEILVLNMLQHPNLVKLIGYCAEDEERMVVSEYMPKGSLARQLFDLPPDGQPLGWNTRVKIATEAAKGLVYLHDTADPQTIHRNMKSANILLDDEFNVKLSDFGLTKFGNVGTHGYCAPEFFRAVRLTYKSDVYSFGVILLELITGRKAFDESREIEDQLLVDWSRHYRYDARRYTQLADPLLQGRYPGREFRQLVQLASTCLWGHPAIRPPMRDVLVALEDVASRPYVDPDGEERVHGGPPA